MFFIFFLEYDRVLAIKENLRSVSNMAGRETKWRVTFKTCLVYWFANLDVKGLFYYFRISLAPDRENNGQILSVLSYALIFDDIQ